MVVGTRRVFGLEQVVEVERRLVGVGGAGEAEGVRDEAAVGAARKVVVVADHRVGGRSQVFLPLAVHDPQLPVCSLVVQVGRARAAGRPDIFFEAEVHARPAFLHEERAIRGLRLVLKLELGVVEFVAGVVVGDIDAVAIVAAAADGRVPEVDVERREGETEDARRRAAVDRRGIGRAVTVRVEDLLQRSIGVEAVERAVGRDGEKPVRESAVLQVLRARCQTGEGHRNGVRYVCIDGLKDRHARSRRSSNAGTESEEVSARVHAIHRVAGEGEAGHRTHVCDHAKVAGRRVAGRSVRLVETRLPAVADGVVEFVGRVQAGDAAEGDRVDRIRRDGVGVLLGRGLVRVLDRHLQFGRVDRARPVDRGRCCLQRIARPRTNRDRAGGRRGEPGGRGGRRDVRKREIAGPVRGEAPRVGDRRASHTRRGVGVAERAVDCRALQARVGELERAPRAAEFLGGERLLGGGRGSGLGRGGNVVVADRRRAAGNGVDREEPARVGAGAVLEELAVGPHSDVAARVLRRSVQTVEHRLTASAHRIDRFDRRAGVDEERHIAERERRDVQAQARRRRGVEELLLWSGHQWKAQRPVGARHVAVKADVIFGNPGNGVDRLEPDEGVGRRLLEVGIEGGRQPLVARNRDVIAKLRRGIRGRHRHAALDRSAAGRQARRQLHRADERIELAEAPAGRVVEIVALSGARLVGGDVGIAADVEQLPILAEHRDVEIAA